MKQKNTASMPEKCIRRVYVWRTAWGKHLRLNLLQTNVMNATKIVNGNLFKTTANALDKRKVSKRSTFVSDAPQAHHPKKLSYPQFSWDENARRKMFSISGYCNWPGNKIHTARVKNLAFCIVQKYMICVYFEYTLHSAYTKKRAREPCEHLTQATLFACQNLTKLQSTA